MVIKGNFEKNNLKYPDLLKDKSSNRFDLFTNSQLGISNIAFSNANIAAIMNKFGYQTVYDRLLPSCLYPEKKLIPDPETRVQGSDAINNRNDRVTVVIPAHNDENLIGSIVLRTRQQVDRVIVVDNGSEDNTAEVAALAGAEIIRNHTKKGKGATLSSGFKAANGSDIIITLDIDNQYDIDKIPEIIDSIKNENCDIVVGISSNNNNISAGKENILLLNEKRDMNNKLTNVLALSSESLNKIDISPNGSSIKKILSDVENNQLKVAYLNLADEPDAKLFNNYNIGVVIPAYNEELLIEETISGIPKYVDKIYLIDDASTDRTPEIIKTLTDLRITSVRHKTNKGVGAAIITGYKLALEDEMDIVAVMAGDNQMDPEQLPRLLKPIIEDQADYTKGNRLLSKDFRKGMSDWRKVGNGLLTLITKIGSGYWHIMDPQNGYTAISRQALEVLNLDIIYPYYGYCNDLLIKLNAFGMKAVDVVMPARYGMEKSSINYSKYIFKVAPMIFISFLWRLKTKYMVLDFHPLVLFYLASMIMVPIGVLFGIYILVYKIMGLPISQNYPLMNALILLIGFQFLLFAMLFDMQESKDGRVWNFTKN